MVGVWDKGVEGERYMPPPSTFRLDWGHRHLGLRRDNEDALADVIEGVDRSWKKRRCRTYAIKVRCHFSITVF